MNSKDVIQAENKQAFKKFIILIVISTLMGLVVGIGAAKAQGSMTEAVAGMVEGFLRAITPYATIAITMAGAILITVLYKKAKSGYEAWDEEEEEAMDGIEAWLSYAMYGSSVMLLANFFFSAVGIVFMDLNSMMEKGTFSFFQLMLWFVSLIGNMAVVTFAQKKIVDLTKEMNPEKKGSIYDPRFTKKWEDSCDEAERVIINRCGYKAYSAVNMTCLILWFICLVGSTIWDFGILPVAMVSIIWMVSMTSYMMEERCLSKRKK